MKLSFAILLTKARMKKKVDDKVLRVDNKRVSPCALFRNGNTFHFVAKFPFSQFSHRYFQIQLFQTPPSLPPSLPPTLLIFKSNLKSASAFRLLSFQPYPVAISAKFMLTETRSMYP